MGLRAIALAAAPAAFVWSTFWAVLLARLITAGCRLAAALPRLAARCARIGLIGCARVWTRRRWRATPRGRRRVQAVLLAVVTAPYAAFGAYLLAALAARAIALPAQVSFTDRGATLAAAPEASAQRSADLRVAAIGLILFVLLTLRAALRAAHEATVAAREQGALFPHWLSYFVSAEDRRMIAAEERLHDRMTFAACAGSGSVTYLCANNCYQQIGVLLGPAVRALIVCEIVLFSVLSVLVCRRLAGQRASTRTIFMIIDCLGAAEQEPAWHQSDPLGTLRAALDRLAARLRSHARRAERRAALHTAVAPYPLVLRGVARSLDRFTAGRASISGRMPPQTTTMLRRTTGVLAGSGSHDTLRRLARSVRAYRADGTPDPQLVVRVPRWFIRWGAALPGKIEGTRRLLSTLAWLAVTALAIALFATGRLSLASIPTWVKP